MKMLLAGQWVDRDKPIDVRDPFDNSLIDTVPRATAADVETALAAAVKGFEVARRMTVYERAQVLFKTAAIVQGRRAAGHQTCSRQVATRPGGVPEPLADTRGVARAAVCQGFRSARHQ